MAPGRALLALCLCTALAAASAYAPASKCEPKVGSPIMIGGGWNPVNDGQLPKQVGSIHSFVLLPSLQQRSCVPSQFVAAATGSARQLAKQAGSIHTPTRTWGPIPFGVELKHSWAASPAALMAHL